MNGLLILKIVKWSIAIQLLNYPLNVLYAQSALKVQTVGITVSDLARAEAFYTQVLPFKNESSYTMKGKELQALLNLPEENLSVKISTLSLGDESIQLMEFENEVSAKAIPFDSKSNDLWFQHIAIVVSDMDSAYRLLRKNFVQHVSTAPQTLPAYIPAAVGISAFYFRDPDGHNLEIIQFPPGKGNPKWQKAEGIFLGIDHTALGISSTQHSTAFYEDILGLKIAGSSENYGPEQERLNQVFGAHLLITGLQAQEGFGVEFLHYLAPPGGRNYPEGSKTTDLWHWHTQIQVQDLSEVYQKLKDQLSTIVSSEIITFSNPSLNFQKALLARDPDGHALLLTE